MENQSGDETMNKELNPGDIVKIVSARDKKDLPLVGKIVVVVQSYNGTVDIQKDSKYHSLSKSTIVRRVDVDNDKLDEVQMNPTHQGDLYFIEYSMKTNTKVIARVYMRQSNNHYELIDEIDVETLIWKALHMKGVDD